MYVYSQITSESKNYNYQYDLPKKKSKSNNFFSSPIPKQLGNVVTILNERFNMPKLELLTFDGNPLNYWRFINNFETNIANETITTRKRPPYLIQHCKEARDPIENCSILDPENRYKDILERQFGDLMLLPNRILSSLIMGRKLDQWMVLGLKDLLVRCKFVS